MSSEFDTDKIVRARFWPWSSDPLVLVADRLLLHRIPAATTDVKRIRTDYLDPYLIHWPVPGVRALLLSSEYGTYKTVKDRFWTWIAGKVFTTVRTFACKDLFQETSQVETPIPNQVGTPRTARYSPGSSPGKRNGSRT